MKTPSVERKASNVLLREWCAAVTGDVLSVGSSQDGDKEGRSYRDYFTNAVSYRTSDVAPGADAVIDVRATGLPDACYDAVFCCGVLEHVDDCHAAVRELFRILKPGGWLLVGVPFMQGIHRAPMDFWRFTEFGLRWLLKAFQEIDVRAIGDVKAPLCYWARARKA